MSRLVLKLQEDEVAKFTCPDGRTIEVENGQGSGIRIVIYADREVDVTRSFEVERQPNAKT